MFQSNVARTAANATRIRSTRCRSTRSRRSDMLLRVVVVTTGNSKDSVARLSQSSERRWESSSKCDCNAWDSSLLFSLLCVLGQDHQENRPAYGMHRLQVPQASTIEALQALRVGRWQEAKGPDDPVLSCCFLIPTHSEDPNKHQKNEINVNCEVQFIRNSEKVLNFILQFPQN